MSPRRGRLLPAARRALVPSVVWWAVAGATAAGERPFDAESATLLPAATVELEVAASGALDTARVLYPDDHGDQIVLPSLGMRAGLGAWGEIRVEGVLWQRFANGDTASGVGDWTVATKIRFGSPPGRLSFAGLARMKIPVASDADGLGTNLADIELAGIAGIHTQPVEIDLDLGVAILGAPFRERAQIDLLTYAVCLRREVRPGLAAGVELAGREGGDFFPTRSMARGGIRWQRRQVRWDAALGFGLADGSPSLEVRAGATFRFDRQPAPPASASRPASGGWTESRNEP